MEEKRKMKKSTKYLLIGTLVLFLSILGASVAYYLARVSEEFGGNAAGTELTINVEKLSSKATGDLIPLDNDLETLNLAAAGYDDNGACVDINGYSVCQIYHITLTNNGSVPLTVNGTVTLSGQNVPNIDCATMTSATEVANNNSCMGGNVFVSGDTLNANDHNDYYVMVYINNLDEPQTDSGEFTGTVTFTTEDGRKVKGRFTKPFNLVNHIETLYNNNKDADPVVNNNIDYQYASQVGLMNDRLGGTTLSLDGGNIRYYGAEPNNYIDIGDKTEVAVEKGNWEIAYAAMGISTSDFPFNDEQGCLNSMADVTDATVEEYFGQYGFTTVADLCDVTDIPEGQPILWRIIGVFDGKLRIVRDESIGQYSWDTSSSDINDGNGINQWSPSGNYEGADIMKLLNPGYETNQDFDSDGTTKITINNSLYWNSGSGKCYNGWRYTNIDCDFTNTGLSDKAKEYVIEQTLNLGGFNTNSVFANQAYEIERGSNVIQNPSDGITRTLTWTGKVGLIYPSDYGYAADFSDSNCQDNLNNFDGCTENWMNGTWWTVSPGAESARSEMGFDLGSGFSFPVANTNISILPVLTLDSSALAETGTGSKSSPYVLTS